MLGLDRLVARLVALTEDAQRVYVLSEMIDASTPEETAEVLVQAMQAIAEGDPRPRVLVDVFHTAVERKAIEYEVLTALYEALGEYGADDVQRMLLAPPPQESAGGRREPAGSLAAEGKTLGMRKWLARRASTDTLDRLLCDPDAEVIANVLKNPYLTEAGVVRIVARRPNFPEVLAAVCRCARWNRRYSVRRSVAFNPYTPVDLALRQVPFLNRSDLYAVAADPKLHQELRDRAAALARRRPPDKVQGESAEQPAEAELEELEEIEER